MWRYLVLNGLWFAILFLVHFFGNRKSRRFILLMIFAAAAYMAVRGATDPFVWFFYVLFSLAVFSSAPRFRQWASAETVLLDRELENGSQKLEEERARVSEKNRETEIIGREAGQIAYLADKIREMSQSLGVLETLLIFGEALARDFKFEALRLIFFEEAGDSPMPQEITRLSYQDFQGFFDRAALLKDPSRTKGERSFLDLRTSRLLFKDRAAVCQPSFVAYPIFFKNRIAAALIILGADEKNFRILLILAERFASEIQRIKLYEHVEMLAVTDGLTGVAVRRHFIERLTSEFERSKRLDLKLSFLMIDIDHFKNFNDQHGHLVGDVILKEVAGTIRKNIREVDLVGRYGGEEFAVFLVETDESGAFFTAERIRRVVSEKDYRAYNEDLKVTVSIGCSTFSRSAPDMQALIESADAALYQAKHQGRNRVQISSLSGSEAENKG